MTWFSFILVGLFAAALTFVLQKILLRRTRVVASMLVVLAIAATVFHFFAGPTTLGLEDWWQQSPWREMILFVSMLIGMAVRYFTKAIEERRDKLIKWRTSGSGGKRPTLEIDKWEFAYPLLLSAITFGALLSQLKSDQVTLENVLLSFQTGFFWQTLLAAKLRET